MSTVARARALANIHDAIGFERVLPDFVFSDGWSRCVFFDSDRIFEQGFVAVLKSLLRSEDASVACLYNSRVAAEAGEEEGSIFLSSGIAPAAYTDMLLAERPNGMWRVTMDHYGCVSDVGKWCIYCEKNNEMGIMAFRDAQIKLQSGAAIQLLNALPVEQALEHPNSWTLSKAGGNDLWRNALLKSYGTERIPGS